MTFSTATKPSAVALITGASAGLGAEYARQLAQSGYNLVLTARRLDRLETMASELRQRYGVSVTCLSADLSLDSGMALVEEKIRALPDLEILVNNAGFGLHGRFEAVSIEENLAMVQVHVLATMRLAYAALPGMRRRRRGWVINVSSMSAFLPIKNVNYSATKAYLVNFTEALETELIGSGVHAQVLCPGFTYTEFHDSPPLSKIRQSLPGWLWMKAEDVVSDSLRHRNTGRVVVVPGWHYKIAHFLARAPLSSSLIRTTAILLISWRR